MFSLERSTNKGKLAALKSAIKATVSKPPNGYMVIPAKSTDVLKNGTSMAMVSSTAKLTDSIEVTPVVLSFDPYTAIVNIEVSNHGNRPVLIQRSAVIAELQQVSFVVI